MDEMSAIHYDNIQQVIVAQKYILQFYLYSMGKEGTTEWRWITKRLFKSLKEFTEVRNST